MKALRFALAISFAAVLSHAAGAQEKPKAPPLAPSPPLGTSGAPKAEHPDKAAGAKGTKMPSKTSATSKGHRQKH